MHLSGQGIILSIPRDVMEKWRAKAGSGVETGPEGLELAAVMTIIICDTDSREKWSRFSHWV